MRNLIVHNLNKARGQFLSFGVVMMITAIILNSALVLLFQTSDAYDLLFEELNTADLSVAVPAAYSGDELAGDILRLEGVGAVDTNEALFAQSTLQDFQDSEFTMNTYFYRVGDERELTRHNISQEIETSEEMSAYIPLYLSELGGYKVGGDIRYVIDGREYRFIVKGLVEEMQYGNYGTGFIGLFLTDETYDRIKADEGYTPVIPVVPLLDCRTTKDSRTMVSSTIVLFLAVFAGLVLLVSIFLSRFRIKNTIDEEMNEMGVLKGIGYTSGMLKLCQVIPYLLVCGAGLVCGVALSYALIPVMAHVLAVQSGFSYTPVWDVSAALITVLSVLIAVFLFTLSAAGKIKRLEPINAIRGIDPLKPAGRNHFPLDRAKGPVWLGLICKQAGVSVRRNILLFAVAFVMMILLTFTGILFYNVNIRPDNFLTTLSEELPDIRVQTSEDKYDALRDILQEENIKAVNYGVVMTEYGDGSIPTIVCEDYSLLENNIVYSGSHPQKEGEIAVGSSFEGDYAIGDRFSLSLENRQCEYVITGFIQSVNNNGIIAEVTDAGYGRISDSPMCSLNLYLGDRGDVATFIDKLDDVYGEYVVNVSNAAKETESMQKMYASLITVVAVILFILAMLIILLILYVILRSMILSLKTEFGIYKSMGYTSNQLIVQTVGSITPFILFGALISAVSGILYLPAMFQGIFSVIGAIKNNFEIPLYILLVMAVILTAGSMMIGVILCRPIKKIAAYSLIKE